MVRSHWKRLRGALGLWLVSASACVAAPFSDERSGLADGVECEADADCKSGSCGKRSRLCAHSLCDCPGDTCTKGGEQSPDCSAGWTCVYYETIFGDIGEAFNIERDHDGGYCRPMCSAGCPEHYVCTDGMFCTPDYDWAKPRVTVTWSGAVEGSTDAPERRTAEPLEIGKTVTLEATAKSPLGLSLKPFEWQLQYGSGGSKMSSGSTVSFALEEGQSYGRVELSVHDSEARTTIVAISFDACFGAGHTCGYQGSGCCAGCDKDSNTCR